MSNELSTTVFEGLRKDPDYFDPDAPVPARSVDQQIFFEMAWAGLRLATNIIPISWVGRLAALTFEGLMISDRENALLVYNDINRFLSAPDEEMQNLADQSNQGDGPRVGLHHVNYFRNYVRAVRDAARPYIKSLGGDKDAVALGL